MARYSVDSKDVEVMIAGQRLEFTIEPTSLSTPEGKGDSGDVVVPNDTLKHRFVFAFLPDDGYFIQVGKNRRMRNTEIITPAKNFRVLELSVSSDGAYAMLFVGADGGAHLACSSGASKLAKWVQDPLWEHRPGFFTADLRFNLGKNGSLFAQSSGVYRWHSADEGLEENLQARIGCDSDGKSDEGWQPGWRPGQVCFGVENTWLVVHNHDEEFPPRNYTTSRNFGEHYPELERHLKKYGSTRHSNGHRTKLAYLALNPFEPNNYFIAWCSGRMAWRTNRECRQRINELKDRIRRSNRCRPSCTSAVAGRENAVEPTRNSSEMSFTGPNAHSRGKTIDAETAERELEVTSAGEAIISSAKLATVPKAKPRAVEPAVSYETTVVEASGSKPKESRQATKYETVQLTGKASQEHEEASGKGGGTGWRNAFKLTFTGEHRGDNVARTKEAK